MPPDLHILSLDQLATTPRNPRSGLSMDDPGLLALAQGLTSGATEPHLTQPPAVIASPNGPYRIIFGERRVRAAQQAGWAQIACLVYPADTSPAEEFRLRWTENMHRQELHPLDRALTLHLVRLQALAEAMGLGAEAEAVLANERGQGEAVRAFETLLAENGFQPNHPPLTWDAILDRYGLDLSSDQRKRLLRLLSLAPDVIEQARPLDMTEAALRSLGQLDPDDQRTLLAAIADDPSLARKIRRISRAMRDLDYTLEDAIAEAQGRVAGAEDLMAMAEPDNGKTGDGESTAGSGSGGSGGSGGSPDGSGGSPDGSGGNGDMPPELPPLLLTLMDQSEVMMQTVESLIPYQAHLGQLPAPWDAYCEAIQMTAQTVSTMLAPAASPMPATDAWNDEEAMPVTDAWDDNEDIYVM